MYKIKLKKIYLLGISYTASNIYFYLNILPRLIKMYKWNEIKPNNKINFNNLYILLIPFLFKLILKYIPIVLIHINYDESFVSKLNFIMYNNWTDAELQLLIDADI